jgi:hypothetical protein
MDFNGYTDQLLQYIIYAPAFFLLASERGIMCALKEASRGYWSFCNTFFHTTSYFCAGTLNRLLLLASVTGTSKDE